METFYTGPTQQEVDEAVAAGTASPLTTVEDDAIEVFEAKDDPLTWVDIAFAGGGIVLVVAGIALAFLA